MAKTEIVVEGVTGGKVGIYHVRYPMQQQHHGGDVSMNNGDNRRLAGPHLHPHEFAKDCGRKH